MRLAAGDRLGPYEIVGPIGKGGMGEVYRATDTRLERPVAIKVSAREFNDRFEREARAISALNHPNICTLYDVGPNYLVMELVEGETLSTIIGRGPLPLDRALGYAIQIVDALAAAHAKNIIHRDLKPGNIMITRNGVKVLDFGLAKLGAERPAGDIVETLTEPITRTGDVLGTLHYMAPEQVEGKQTDERSDIFSFGVVVYEMLTGQRPFTGDTQASVLASMLKDPPPPMNQRQPPVPRALERLVRKCLEKKPDDRWQSARDLKPALELIDLEAPSVSTSSANVPIPVAVAPRPRWLWPSLGAAVLVLIAAVVVWAVWFRPAPSARATRFQVTLPENVQFDVYVSVSPDGHKLLFNATGEQSGLWIHDLDTLEWRRLAGTDAAVSPFWSPDSRFVGFAVRNQLKKIEVAGGPSQTLCTVQGSVGTGAWSKDGVILFGGRGTGVIRRVSAAGGFATDVTSLDGARGETFHALPSFLPDGKHFLYLRGGNSETAGIYAGLLDAKPAEQPRERILATTFAAPYVDGNLFFVRDGTLMVQPFDAGKLQFRGEPVPVVEHVQSILSTGVFSVSPSGVLAYRSGSNTAMGYQLTWFDHQGKTTGTFGQPTLDFGIRLSEDGTRGAVRNGPITAGGDIWLLDFVRDLRTRFTFHQSPGSAPVWSSDGSHIFFAGGGSLDTILEKPANGAGEEKPLLAEKGKLHFPTSLSHDGRFLLYYVTTPNPDMWVLPLEAGRQPVRLLGTEFTEMDASFSPDGRWIAYLSDESGRAEIYVRPFEPSGPSLGGSKWQVSRDGAVNALPKWRNDGKEIFFMGANNSINSVDVVASGAALQLGTPKPLFAAPNNYGWDVTSDGKRFLVAVQPGGGSQTPITVILNWQADLKR